MQIYEFYTGTRWSYEAQGKFDYKEFTDEIRRLFPIQSLGKHFGDVVFIHKKFGRVKAKGENNRFYDTLIKCSKGDQDAKIYTKVVMLH